MVDNLDTPRVSYRPEGYAAEFPFGELPVSPLQINSGATVNVDISKIRAESKYDFVAIYCPPKGINDLDFLDYMNVTQASNGILAFDSLGTRISNSHFSFLFVFLSSFFFSFPDFLFYSFLLHVLLIIIFFLPQ